MGKRWLIKRWAVAVFATFHASALILWNLPTAQLQVRVGSFFQYYMMPLGLAQNWGMFAPNPPVTIMRLEALTSDSKGILRVFEFPRLAGRPVGEAFWEFRISKHMHNFDFDFMPVLRQCGAKHAVRQLNIPEDAYPVDVELVYHLEPITPMGKEPDPLQASARHTIERYRFPTAKEVHE